MKKRFCSGFLALVMLFSAIPVSATGTPEPVKATVELTDMDASKAIDSKAEATQTPEVNNTSKNETDQIQEAETEPQKSVVMSEGVKILKASIDELKTLKEVNNLTEEEINELKETVSSLYKEYNTLKETEDVSEIDIENLSDWVEYFEKSEPMAIPEEPTPTPDEETYGGQTAIDWTGNYTQAITGFEPYGQSCEEGDNVTVTITIADGFSVIDVTASLQDEPIEMEADSSSTDSVLIYNFTVPQIPFTNTENIIFDIQTEWKGYLLDTELTNVETDMEADTHVKTGDTFTATLTAKEGYILLEDDVKVWVCENGNKTEEIEYTSSPQSDLSGMGISFEVPDKGVDAKYSIIIEAVAKKNYKITNIEYDDGEDVVPLSINFTPSILYQGVTVTIPTTNVPEWNTVMIYDTNENIIQKYYYTNQEEISFSMPASDISIEFLKGQAGGNPMEDVNIPSFDPGWGTTSTIEDEPEVKLNKSAAWTNIEQGLAQLNISTMDLGNVYSWPCDYIILVDCSATMRNTDAGQSVDRYTLAMNAINTLVSHIEQANANFPQSEKSQVAYISYSGAEDESKRITTMYGKIKTRWSERKKYGKSWEDYAGIFTYQPLTTDYAAVRQSVNSSMRDACRGSKSTLALEKTLEMLNNRADKSRFAKVIILSDENLYDKYADQPGLHENTTKFLDAINAIDKCYITQIYVGSEEGYNADKATIESKYVKSYTAPNGENRSLLFHYKNNANGFLTYMDAIEDIAIALYANDKVLTDVINTNYWDIVKINNYGAKKADGTKITPKTAPNLSGNKLTWNLGNGSDTVEKTYSVTIDLKLKDQYRYLLSDTSYPTNIDGATKGCKVHYTISDGKYKGQTKDVYASTPSLKYGAVEFDGQKVWSVQGAEADGITIKLKRKMPSQEQSYEIDSILAKAPNYQYSFTNAARKTAAKVPLIKYDNEGKTVIYSIEEQVPSYYSHLGNKASTINGKTTTKLYNEPYKIKATLTKTDEETGNKLSGAVFNVYQWSKKEQKYVAYTGKTHGKVPETDYEAGTMFADAMTMIESSKGVYITPSWLYYTNDNEGKFRVIETTAPTGYFGDFKNNNITNKQVYDFSIAINGSNNKKTITINNQEDEFTNQRVLGEITFNKYDLEAQEAVPQGDATLSGAVYKLYAAEDIVHQDQSGTILYKAGEEIHLIANGTENGCNSYTYKDKTETNDYVDLVTSEKAGIYIDELEIGRYCLKEQSAGEGYLVNPTAIYFRVEYEDETIPVVSLDNENLTNEKGDSLYLADQVKKQKLNFYKVTGQDTEDQLDPLTGAKFTIYLVSDLKGGKYKDYTDAELIQAMIDDYRNPTTLLYDDIKKETPATVYDEPNSEDVTSGRLVKEFTYGSGKTAIVKSSNENAYIVAELSSNERGVVETPALPYGRYVVIETTTPKDKSATRPFVINVIADDEDEIKDGDGKGTPLSDLVILMDHEVSSLIRIEKVDSESHKVVLKEGAQYLIHDINGSWYDYYTQEMTTAQKEAYKEKYGDLVVQYTQGFYLGTKENPYTTKMIPSAKSEEKSVYIETPEVLPPGTYEIEEINAPDGYILTGHEGVIAKDTRMSGNGTYYETEEEGAWTNVPGSNSRVTITTAEASYDEEIGKYIVTVRQVNNPAIGKISIYAEGEQLVTAVQAGSTILSRLGDKIENFFGYLKILVGLTDAKDEADLTTEELEEFKDYVFTYEMGPIEGAQFDIHAAEDIYSQEGGINAEKLFSKGDLVCTLTTDEKGQAWTGQEDWPGTDIAKGLPIGKYTVTQTKATPGFYLSEENATPREIEIAYAGQTVPVIYKDTSYKLPRQKVNVEITKKDRETNDSLAGAVFGLYAGQDIINIKGKTIIKEGTLIAIAETSVDKDAVLNAVFEADLPLANYYVREISAPMGYANNSERVDIDATWKEDGRPVIEANQIFTNLQTQIQVNLMDYYTEEELDGAQITILDEEGNSFTTMISVHDNNVVVRGLEIDKTYTLKELVSPDGYSHTLYTRDDYESPYVKDGAVELDKTLVDEGISFKVQDTENLQILSVFNKPILGEIDVIKTGEVATGYDEIEKDGRIILTPTYEMKGLPGAEYVLRAKEDITYPDGYTGTVYQKGDLILEVTKPSDDKLYGIFNIQAVKGELLDVSQYIGTVCDEDMMEFFEEYADEVERQIPSEEEINSNTFMYKGTPVSMVIKTDENGEASIYGLPVGDYEIIEVKAPVGYAREMKDVIQDVSFAIDDTEIINDIIHVKSEFENNPILPNPKDDGDEGNEYGSEPTIITYHPAVKIIKAANKDLYDPGETITYQITVVNTGDADLKELHITDSLLGGEIKLIPYLAIGEKEVFTCTYQVPEDAKAGEMINNTITVVGTPVIPDPGKDENDNQIVVDPCSYKDVTDTDIEKVSVTGKDIIVQKVADKLLYKPGEVVVYKIRVMNPNHYALTDVEVTDSIGGTFISTEYKASNGKAIIDEIPPEGEVELIYQYQIPEDAEAGNIKNIVVATGTTPEEYTKNPEITVVKTADKYMYKAGETATYDIVVTNTGNVDLTDVVVTDTLKGTFVQSPEIGNLKVGESKTLSYQYRIPKDAKGIVNNIAIAEGKTPPTKENPDGIPVKSEDDEDIVVIGSNPSIHIEKYADKQIVKPGDEVTYTLEVKNDGDTDLTDVVITDDHFELENGTIGELKVGETKLITYVATIPENIQIGDKIPNVATVTGKEVVTPDQPIDPDDPTPAEPKEVTDSDDEILIVDEKRPAIRVMKISDKKFYEPGETVTYQIRVTNTGNVDLTNVEVEDILKDGTWVTTPKIGELAVGETKNLIYTYVIPETANQGDQIANEATATGIEKTDPDQPVDPDNPNPDGPKQVEDKDDTIIEVVDPKGIHVDITKTANAHMFKPGEVVTYTIIVRNNGNVDLTDVNVTDSLEGGTWIDDPAIGDLAVGEKAELRYEYTIPEDAENNMEIPNTAKVTGTEIVNPDEPESTTPRTVESKDDETVKVTTGEKVTDDDDETIVIRNPKINVLKTADKDVYQPGETAVYTIMVTNSGNVKLENVTVDETILDGEFTSTEKGTFEKTHAEIGDLDVGETVKLTFEYVVNNLTKQTNVVVAIGTPESPEDPDNPGNKIPENPIKDKDEEDIYTKIRKGLSITKYGVDDGRTPVAGAEYTMYAKEDIKNIFDEIVYPAGTEIETAVTNENGIAHFITEVPLGSYVVKETKAPSGYYSTSKEILWDTTGYEHTGISNYSYHEEVENAITEVNIKVVDDKTYHELSNAAIQVVDKDGNVVEAWITKTGDGYTIKGLNTDTEYTIVEVTPRDGYLNKVTDIYEEGSLNLSGMTFVIPSATTGITDEGSLDKATIPEAGRIVLANPFVTGDVRLNKDGEMLDSWTLIDKLTSYVKSLFNFKKEALEGVEFTVYAKEDIIHPDGVTGTLLHAGDIVNICVRSKERPAIGITDKTGTVLFNEMYLGKYVIKETKALDGFNLDIEPREVTFVYQDGETSPVRAQDGDISWTNERQKVHIEITKKDKDSNKVLEGAVFALYTRTPITNAEGKTIVPQDTLLETSASGKDGVAVFESDLPLGKYYVKEQKAPNGYDLNDQILEIDATFNSAKDIIEVKETFYNTKTPVQKPEPTKPNKKKHHSSTSSNPAPVAEEMVYDVPTGDSNNLMLYWILLTAAIGTVIVVMYKKRN